MRDVVGIKHKVGKLEDKEAAILEAVKEFLRADHCQDHDPAVVIINPMSRPADNFSLPGLRIVANKRLDPAFIRVLSVKKTC